MREGFEVLEDETIHLKQRDGPKTQGDLKRQEDGFEETERGVRRCGGWE